MEILKKIQKELKVPKNQYNHFGHYKYRSCEDILETVKPLLGSAILVLTDDIIFIGDRYYVKATATIMDGEKQISVNAIAREAESKKGMDAAQITGAASSYARKYALNGLFCIDDTKDADSMQCEKVETYPEQEQVEQLEKFKDGLLSCKTIKDVNNYKTIARQIFCKCSDKIKTDAEQYYKSRIAELKKEKNNGID